MHMYVFNWHTRKIQKINLQCVYSVPILSWPKYGTLPHGKPASAKNLEQVETLLQNKVS